MARRWLPTVLSLSLLWACDHATHEEPYVDSGTPLTCNQQNGLDGSFAFGVTQGVECFAPLADGGPNFGAVTLQLAAMPVVCEAAGASPIPVCSGAGVGDEIYLQYGTFQSPEGIPLSVGSWPVENIDGGPWITVFFTDNAGSQINAQSGQVVLSVLTGFQVSGELQDLVFPLLDGGVATLGGPFCTSFCGLLPDGG